jgi:hypothetical protein
MQPNTRPGVVQVGQQQVYTFLLEKQPDSTNISDAAVLALRRPPFGTNPPLLAYLLMAYLAKRGFAVPRRCLLDGMLLICPVKLLEEVW